MPLLQLRRAASNPVYGGANLQLGEALAAAGYVNEAIAECETATRKSPRSADGVDPPGLAGLRGGGSGKGATGAGGGAAAASRPAALYEELSRRLDRSIRP